MAAFSHDCPDCGTRSASFSVVEEYRSPRYPHQIHAFLSCGVCGSAAVAVFVTIGRQVRAHNLSLKEHLGPSPDEFSILAFHPAPDQPEAPEHMPENVRTFYLQAVANVKTGPDAAGSMFRKALDVGLRHIDKETKGKLFERINALAEAGKLTPELAEWAHHIRLEGNIAAHEEVPYTPEEAAALHRFTELVMLYLFTLPGMIRELKARSEPSDEAESG